MNLHNCLKDKNTFFCFSPPVMLATFAIEIIFGLYILTTSKLSRSSIVIISLLICLGAFQFAEYSICTGDSNLNWMRMGYAAITLLPPLGIHLISLVTKRYWIRNLSYALSAVFVFIFILSTHAIKSAMCGGNYIMVDTGGILASSYFTIYYFLLLAIAIVEITLYAFRTKDHNNHIEKKMFYWLLAGYASFIVPTGAVYLLTPSARNGIPSIMCGFAVLLAIILTFKVYPLCKKAELFDNKNHIEKVIMYQAAPLFLL